MISFSKILSKVGRGVVYGAILGGLYPIITAYNGYKVTWHSGYFIVWVGMGFTFGIIGIRLEDIIKESFPHHPKEWIEARDRAHEETLQRNNNAIWRNINRGKMKY